MASGPSPTIKEWDALYRAVVDFRDLAPWQWMMDSDVFGVRDPATGEVGYCVVIGALGEVFGLIIYLGTEGLDLYLKQRSTEGPPEEGSDLMLSMRGLSCIFGSRRELAREDLKLIETLGVKFRGQTAWPIIRSHRPHYFPWFLNLQEASYLTLALEQAQIVASRFRENEDMFNPPKPGTYFVRVPVVENGSISWEDRWLPPESGALESPAPAIHVDMNALQEGLRSAKEHQVILEVDVFDLPSPVKEPEDERPYYPQMVLWVASTGPIVYFDMFQPWVEFPLQQSLVHLITKAGFLPSEIYVSGQAKRRELAPLAEHLGIKLASVRTLRELPGVRRELVKRMVPRP